MSLLSFLLMLVVAAVVIWGVIQAFAGRWQQLIIAIVVLILALWILGALGVALPSLPTMR